MTCGNVEAFFNSKRQYIHITNSELIALCRHFDECEDCREKVLSAPSCTPEEAVLANYRIQQAFASLGRDPEL